MKILLLGLGRFGTAIAEKLLEGKHEVYIVEQDTGKVERFLKLYPKGDYKICIADATSMLFWEYLPLEEFDLIISSIRFAEFNKTVCRIVREILNNLDIPFVIFSDSYKYEHYFANFNCKTLYIPELASHFVEGLTLKGISKPIAIGLGKNEILEVSVSPKSPYVNVPIRQLRHKHWRIALVYRGEEIILPGLTVHLKAGDRVVLVGDNPKIVLEIAKSMALGMPQFPLSFGENMVVYLTPKDVHFLKEYHYLWKHTRIKHVVIFSEKPEKLKTCLSPEDRDFQKVLSFEKGSAGDIFNRNLQENFSAGVISTPRYGGFLFWKRLRRFFSSEIPFLVPRLSFPYGDILVSLNNENPFSILEQCFEIATLLKAKSLGFVYVKLPEALSGGRDEKIVSELEKTIDYYASIFGVKSAVSFKVTEGNPVKETLKIIKNKQLLIVGYKPRRLSLFEPYTPYVLTAKVGRSVIGIPIEV